MHRTTTTATLLVTVAVSALAGCTTVQRPSAPGAPAAPSRPPLPQPEGRTETQIVQAPAREALQLIEEASRRPAPATPGADASTTRPVASPAATSPRQRPSGRHDAARPRPARPDRPEPADDTPQRPRAELPDVSESVRQDVHRQVPGGTDVCALGRRYGGWRADSPEATICRDTYGR
ncbi:hypothetical protein [Streptomyces dubilierae]|uniref:Lipoprotein n=1 Tax=Streptomyces dubilierae TaxID=3075533 RepID=A0ABU2P9Y9_9ACTN|nr:hypothetical protein [Streptomyces sp. DSM 41921]MDT0388973.1 hypothetical protein [Streptomyces sp. DSM 41921]